MSLLGRSRRFWPVGGLSGSGVPEPLLFGFAVEDIGLALARPTGKSASWLSSPICKNISLPD